MKPRLTSSMAGLAVAVLLIVAMATSYGPADAAMEWTPDVAPAIVTRVIDGDTIEVILDGLEATVRLIGVDTPETVHPSRPVEPYGKEASEFTRQALEGQEVWLEFDVGQLDKYGRLLAYVWTTPPTTWSDSETRAHMHNASLLLKGYGKLMTVQPNVRHVDSFRVYQEEARRLQRGLWDGNPDCDPLPDCIDLNTASYEELQYIIHIGPERAQGIIEVRPWQPVDDLIRISGIGSSRLHDIKEQGLASVACAEHDASATYASDSRLVNSE